MDLVSMQPGIDARTRTIKITRKGMNAFNKAAPLWHGVQSGLIGKLGGERREQLKSLLNELTGATP